MYSPFVVLLFAALLIEMPTSTSSEKLSDKRKILTIEAHLGFKWPRGLSRQKDESTQVPILKAFLAEVGEVGQNYVQLSAKDVRSSPEFHAICEDLFERYGASLWPPSTVDTSAWQVDPTVNDLNGLYPKSLHYDDPADREKYVTCSYLTNRNFSVLISTRLKEHFHDLCREKTIKFGENKRRQDKQTGSPPTMFTPNSARNSATEVDTSAGAVQHDPNHRHLVTPTLPTHNAHVQQEDVGMPPAATYLQKGVVPVAPMVAANPTYRPFTTVRNNQDHSYDDTIVVSNLNRYPQDPPIKQEHLPSPSELGAINLTESSTSEDSYSPPSVVGRKHSRAQSSDSEYIPPKAQKVAQGYKCDRPKPKLIVKLKLKHGPERLASYGSNNSTPANDCTPLYTDFAVSQPRAIPALDLMNRALSTAPETVERGSNSFVPFSFQQYNTLQPAMSYETAIALRANLDGVIGPIKSSGPRCSTAPQVQAQREIGRLHPQDASGLDSERNIASMHASVRDGTPEMPYKSSFITLSSRPTKTRMNASAAFDKGSTGMRHSRVMETSPTSSACGTRDNPTTMHTSINATNVGFYISPLGAAVSLTARNNSTSAINAVPTLSMLDERKYQNSTSMHQSMNAIAGPSLLLARHPHENPLAGHTCTAVADEVRPILSKENELDSLREASTVSHSLALSEPRSESTSARHAPTNQVGITLVPSMPETHETKQPITRHVSAEAANQAHVSPVFDTREKSTTRVGSTDAAPAGPASLT